MDSTYERHWLVALRIALFSLGILLLANKLELPKLLPKFVYTDIIVYDRCHAYFAEPAISKRHHQIRLPYSILVL